MTNEATNPDTLKKTGKKTGKSRAILVTVVVVVIFAIFFLAPVLYWFNASPMVGGNLPVYRSVGCRVVGIGDLYAPNWFGIRLGCHISPHLPTPVTTK